MDKKHQGMIGATWVLIAGLSLSACSGISQQVTGAVSSINPFQQQTEETASVAAPSPVEQQPPATPARSFRVETKPPALVSGTKDVEVNVGGNKQCTTFCALPIRRPPPAAQ